MEESKQATVPIIGGEQQGKAGQPWRPGFRVSQPAPQCIEVKSSLNTPQCTVESFKAASTGSAVHSAGQLHSRPQLSSLQCSVSHLLDHHALLWPSALHATFTHLLKSDNFPTFFTVQVFAVCSKTDQFITLPFEQYRALKWSFSLRSAEPLMGRAVDSSV